MDVQACTWELETCDRAAWAKTLCAKHYKAWHRLNDTPQRQKTRKADRDRKRARLQADSDARQAVRDYNNARYHAQTPDEKAFRSLKDASRKTGIPLDDLVSAYNEHDGRCDVCSRKLEELGTRIGRLNVHHVHGSSVFGGFLCTNCNIAEGHLDGSAQRAYQMYLFLTEQEDRFRKEGGA